MSTTTVTCHSPLSWKTGYYRPLQCSQTPHDEMYRSFLYLAFTDNFSTHPIIHYSQWRTVSYHDFTASAWKFWKHNWV